MFSMRPKGCLIDQIARCLDTAGVGQPWRKRFFFERATGPGWKNAPDRVAPRSFSPRTNRAGKALACELPPPHHVPLSRWSLDELTQHVCQSGLVAQLSSSTLWRWLHQDAIRPGSTAVGFFPRDPNFASKRVGSLDLYQHQWQDSRCRPMNSCLDRREDQTSKPAVGCMKRSAPASLAMKVDMIRA